jgi:NAD+ kinase
VIKQIPMQSPPIDKIQRVALITRGDEQPYPRQELTQLLSPYEIELVEGPGVDNVDFVLALGGDGTVLRAVSAYPKAPTLAVNFGRVGFLTQCDREDLKRVVSRVLNQDYFVEERLALEVIHHGTDGTSLGTWRCINEVVFKGVIHMNELTLNIDGHYIHTARGDGLIVGTPTGSTAYLMSTGAPLVTPGVSCIIANPLNEYRFSSRAIILPGEAELSVAVGHCRPKDLMMIIDGNSPLMINEGDKVVIRRSEVPTLLVAFEPQYFFRNLKERLNW